jgi:NAD(P)H-hydrate epimerase
MGALLGIKTAAVQADRRAAVEQAARRYGCTVLLKGARTLVASPDIRLNVNTTGNPGMATGGSGDVLTGITAAFLARGLGAHEAAAAAAYVHGLAGDLVAAENGATGLIATDFITLLPRAIARCQAIVETRGIL